MKKDPFNFEGIFFGHSDLIYTNILHQSSFYGIMEISKSSVGEKAAEKFLRMKQFVFV